MAVRPIRFNTDGSIDIWHDEANHGGTIQLADAQFAQRIDGSEDLRFLHIDCPVAGCGSHSVHPAGGGCDPEMVQRLFARKLMHAPAAAQPPNLPSQAQRSWDEAKGALKKMVDAMDGPRRWKLEHVAEGE